MPVAVIAKVDDGARTNSDKANETLILDAT
jgi:hypothetical protein